MQPEQVRHTFRLAYVVSHPIQYQSGLLRLIAAQPDIDLLVIFCSDFSAKNYKDAGFGAEVRWDVPLMEGYRSVVLPRMRETSSPEPTRPISFGCLPPPATRVWTAIHSTRCGYTATPA